MSMRGMEEETLVDSGEEGGGDCGEDIMDQDQMIENGMKEALFECSIQLMRSPNQNIISAASSLLAVGFSYSHKQTVERFIVNIYQTIQSQLKVIDKSWKYIVFHDIAKIVSRISFSFANSLLSSLVERINGNEFEDEKEQEEIMSFIACIAQMNPITALENLDKLMKPWKDASDASLIRTTNCKSELISVRLFSCHTQ